MDCFNLEIVDSMVDCNNVQLQVRGLGAGMGFGGGVGFRGWSGVWWWSGVWGLRVVGVLGVLVVWR